MRSDKELVKAASEEKTYNFNVPEILDIWVAMLEYFNQGDFRTIKAENRIKNLCEKLTNFTDSLAEDFTSEEQEQLQVIYNETE